MMGILLMLVTEALLTKPNAMYQFYTVLMFPVRTSPPLAIIMLERRRCGERGEHDLHSGVGLCSFSQLMVFRFASYHRMKWHYFMLDFWFASLLLYHCSLSSSCTDRRWFLFVWVQLLLPDPAPVLHLLALLEPHLLPVRLLPEVRSTCLRRAFSLIPC